MKLAYSVPDWCKSKGLSKSHFYEMDRRGEAPQTFYAGARRLISEDADAAWVAEQERKCAEAKDTSA